MDVSLRVAAMNYVKSFFSKSQWLWLILFAYGLIVLGYGAYSAPEWRASSPGVLKRLSDESLLLMQAGQSGGFTILITLPNGERIPLPSTAVPEQQSRVLNDLSLALRAQHEDYKLHLVLTSILWLVPSCLGFLFLMHLARQSSPYLINGRLADVLVLIQVLALDEDAHRSDEGLSVELQGAPRSSQDWPSIAEQHPEFFRVVPVGKNRVSLVARHVSPCVGGGRPILAPDYTSKLLELAVELHDRELGRSQRWQIWIPVIAAITAGIFMLFSVWLKSVLAGF